MMVGILVSVWDGLFSGAFAVSFREGYYLPQFTDKVWQLIASMHPTLYLAVRLYYPAVTPAPTSLCFGRSLLSEAQHSWVESQKWWQFGGGVLMGQSYKLLQNNSKSLFWHIFDLYVRCCTKAANLSVHFPHVANLELQVNLSIWFIWARIENLYIQRLFPSGLTWASQIWPGTGPYVHLIQATKDGKDLEYIFCVYTVYITCSCSRY